MTMTATITPPSAPPVPVLVLSVGENSITRSSATISWTTNVPSTSQVEFGTGIGVTGRSPVDSLLVTSHTQVLLGLSPGATYHYLVRSISASGVLGISSGGTFATMPDGSGPEFSSVSVGRVTSTTAAIGWTTSTGTVAQLEYGLTTNYETFTLLKVFPLPAQQMLLSGLRPATAYHFRIKAWDNVGALSASGDFTFSTALAGPATLAGDQIVYADRLSLTSGQAAAFQYVATQSGLASAVRVYVDAGSTAAVIRVALYSDQVGSPGTILAQGSAPGLTPGWISVNLPPTSLVQGVRYWIAVLSPIGVGNINLRDTIGGTSSLLSRQSTLAAFPATWTSGTAEARSPISAYIQQLPPSVTLTGPTDGAVVNGGVPLSAVIDDDASIVRIQFFVDGLPIGVPLVGAPYTTTWDSTGFSSSQPHSITARATDLLGRSGASGAVSVQVDNGPNISAVNVSPGLTASSARITWTTDILGDSQVEFGTSILYGLATPVDSRAIWTHEMQVTGLSPGTIYHYRVRSRDANGAVAVSPDAIFATAEP